MVKVTRTIATITIQETATATATAMVMAMGDASTSNPPFHIPIPTASSSSCAPQHHAKNSQVITVGFTAFPYPPTYPYSSRTGERRWVACATSAWSSHATINQAGTLLRSATFVRLTASTLLERFLRRHTLRYLLLARRSMTRTITSPQHASWVGLSLGFSTTLIACPRSTAALRAPFYLTWHTVAQCLNLWVIRKRAMTASQGRTCPILTGKHLGTI